MMETESSWFLVEKDSALIWVPEPEDDEPFDTKDVIFTVYYGSDGN